MDKRLWASPRMLVLAVAQIWNIWNFIRTLLWAMLGMGETSFLFSSFSFVTKSEQKAPLQWWYCNGQPWMGFLFLEEQIFCSSRFCFCPYSNNKKQKTPVVALLTLSGQGSIPCGVLLFKCWSANLSLSFNCKNKRWLVKPITIPVPLPSQSVRWLKFYWIHANARLMCNKAVVLMSFTVSSVASLHFSLKSKRFLILWLKLILICGNNAFPV